MMPYVSYLKLSFLEMMSYRLRYYVGILTYFIFVSVYYYIWQAVYRAQSLPAINGFTFPEMVTYIAIGWISRSFYFSRIDTDIGNMVRNGSIRTFILKPINFQYAMYCRAIGSSLFRFTMFSIPICLLIIPLYGVSAPKNEFAGICFLLSIILGFLVITGINFCVGLISFFTKSIEGIVFAKQSIIQLLSGLLLPMFFFPEVIRPLLEYLPFRSISYIPVMIYMGKTENIAHALAEQFVWGVVFFALGAILWRHAVRKLTIQGG